MLTTKKFANLQKFLHSKLSTFKVLFPFVPQTLTQTLDTYTQAPHTDICTHSHTYTHTHTLTHSHTHTLTHTHTHLLARQLGGHCSDFD